MHTYLDAYRYAGPVLFEPLVVMPSLALST